MNEKLTAADVLNKPRAHGELNYVEQVAFMLNKDTKEHQGKTFLNNPEIKYVIDGNPVAQRLVLNKYLFKTLMRYRDMSGNSVVHLLPLLALDGTTNDWFKGITDFVIPYVHNHGVIARVS